MYEEPTNELRQVKRPIKRGNGVLGPGYREEIVGYETTVQRKWKVAVKGSMRQLAWDEPVPEGWMMIDGPDIPELTVVQLREEWRNLPEVSDPKAP